MPQPWFYAGWKRFDDAKKDRQCHAWAEADKVFVYFSMYFLSHEECLEAGSYSRLTLEMPAVFRYPIVKHHRNSTCQILDKSNELLTISFAVANRRGRIQQTWLYSTWPIWKFAALATITNIWTWASYKIREIVGCACAWNAANFFSCRWLQRKLLVSDPGMHHGMCVTHVPWCMSGSLTRSGGKNVPGIPGAIAPAILLSGKRPMLLVPGCLIQGKSEWDTLTFISTLCASLYIYYSCESMILQKKIIDHRKGAHSTINVFAMNLDTH